MTRKLLFFLIVSLFFFGKGFSENSDIYKKIDLFGEVLEKINEEYVDDVDPIQKHGCCNKWFITITRPLFSLYDS